jgi:hypothetical protein
MEKRMDSDDLKSVKGSIPSLVELGWKEMFGLTEEERLAAGRLRKQLRAAGVRDDPEAYKSAVWKFELPSEMDLQRSECGRQTLQMLKSNQPVGGEIQAKAEGTVVPEPAASLEPAGEPVPEINATLQKLSWPPKGTLLNTPPKMEEEPRDNLWPRYVAVRPSEPDKSQRPISDDDFSSNQPLY